MTRRGPYKKAPAIAETTGFLAALAARKEFTRDRIGHNDSTAGRNRPSRITYVSHGKGWVTARHPGCTPFVISEALWLSFSVWVKP